MKTCSKCKIEKPFEAFRKRTSASDGLRGVCIECQNARTRYINATPEGKVRAKARHNRYMKTEKGRAVVKRQNASNATKLRKAEWKKTDKGLEAEGRYNTSEKGMSSRHKAVAKRRAVKLNAPSDNWTPLEVFNSADWNCFYCGVDVEARQVSDTYQDNEAQADHFIPLAKGGTNLRANIVCSCGSCNHKKLSKNPFEFIRDNININGGTN